ncbi:MAG: N-acyl-D-amino-acid deacylase family protein [Vulcanimicrobiaceae bacterium]
MISLVLERARIVDGTGRPAFTTDVAIVGGRIALIGDLSHREAYRRIDCRNKTLAPGFIDCHSHDEQRWQNDSRFISKISSGVTTAIIGNCGRRSQQSVDSTLRLIEHERPALNIGMLYGLETIPNASDVRDACEQGAFGVSDDRSIARETPEAHKALCAALAIARDAERPLYAAHLRDYGTGIADALDEALDDARHADVALLCEHFGVRDRARGSAHRLLESIDRARASGTPAYAGCYPYVATWDYLRDVLPPQLQTLPDARLHAALEDPAYAATLALALAARVKERWAHITIASVPSQEWIDLCGETIEEIARSRRLSPAHVAVEMLRTAGGAVRTFDRAFDEDDVATILAAEFTAIGSCAPSYGLDTGIYGLVHPRAFGTSTRVFGRYVRRRRAFDEVEAVRRMTSLPAQIFNLRGRGTIEIGAYADIVVFDPETIADTATYARPASLSVGIEYVLVNGHVALADGRLTDERAGHALRAGG